MTLDAALDELFASPMADFISTRDALAKKLKADGRGDDAKVVAGQHKPTQAAWALNALVREHRAEVDALVAAGNAVVKAQKSGAGVREALGEQRTASQTISMTLAQTLNAHKLPASLLHELGPLLQMASVDPDLAEELRQGRSSKVPEASVGFFGLPAGKAEPAAAPEEKPAKKAKAENDDVETKDDERQKQRAAAEAAKRKEVEAAAEAALAELKAAQREVESRDRAVASAEAGVAAAKQVLEDAEALAKQAREAAKEAGVALRQAQKAAQHAEAEIRGLSG